MGPGRYTMGETQAPWGKYRVLYYSEVGMLFLATGIGEILKVEIKAYAGHWNAVCFSIIVSEMWINSCVILYKEMMLTGLWNWFKLNFSQYLNVGGVFLYFYPWEC